MENCKKHSKLLCSQCRHFDYYDVASDVARRCDGVCYECDVTDCENNPDCKERTDDE